jgi:hypothetical protein
MGPAVNTAEYEYGPLLSRDGSLLYFTSHKDGPANIYEADVAGLGIGPDAEPEP